MIFGVNIIDAILIGLIGLIVALLVLLAIALLKRPRRY